MYSIMMTGYMFQNAQYRLELQQGLEQPAALPDVQDTKVIFFLIFFSLSVYEPCSSFWSLKKPFTTLSFTEEKPYCEFEKALAYHVLVIMYF